MSFWTVGDVMSCGRSGLAFARSTGCPSRATFRIDMRERIILRASASPCPTTFRFCPVCGGALESRSLKAGDPDRLVCRSAASCSTWTRKSPSARSSTTATGGSCWCGAPSSLATASGCSPAATSIAASRCWPRPCARRARNAASTSALDGLVDIYSYAGGTPIIIVFAATLVGGDLQVDEEGLEARWFAAGEVPWAELAFRSTHEAIRDYFEGAHSLVDHWSSVPG